MGPSEPISSLENAAAGDSAAQQQLLLDHYERALAFITARFPTWLRDALAPEDVLQQAYVHAFRGITGRKFPTAEAFWAWLRTIAQNCLLDELRKTKRKKRSGQRITFPWCSADDASLLDFLELPAESYDAPSREVQRNEAIDALRAALAELDDDYRTVLTLYVLQEKEIAEVAQVMKRTPDAIRGLIYRAKKNLRAFLGRSSLFLSR